MAIKPKQKLNHMQVEVKLRQIENINGTTQNYLVIETERGKIHISIGDKNYVKLSELIKDSVKNSATPDGTKK